MNKRWQLLFLVCAGWMRGADLESSGMFDPSRMLEVRQEKQERAPKIDPKRIVNDSNAFLKEREPEMTAEEYALYEKVVNMLAQNPQFAVRLLEAMVNEKEKPSPAFEFILGNAYYTAGEIQKAETFYRSAVDRFPTFVRAWNNLGVLYYTSERYGDAVPCFSKAVVLGDRDPTTFGLLGYCLEKTGNVVSAEMAFMQALAGAPDHADWKEGLLRIYIQGKQFGRAESLARSLIKEQPAQTRFWLTYANILLAQNRKLEAAAVLESSAGMGVAGPDELTLLGDLYAEQKLAHEALEIYARVLSPSPEMGERKLLHFAQVLIAAGKLDEAEKAVGMLNNVELTPEGKIVRAQTRADIFAARQQWAESRAEIETILKVAPMNGRALLALGRAYVGDGDEARAIFAFEAASRVPSSAYRANLELANIELKNRHYEKSAEYLQKALGIEKSDAVEDYLARVRTLAAKGGEPAS